MLESLKKDQNINELPLSVQALGGIAFDGTSQKVQERLGFFDETVILDNKLCFKKANVPCSNTKMWVRIPAFYPLLKKEEQKKFDICFQINDVATLSLGYSTLNSLVFNDIVYPLTITPNYSVYELSEFEIAKINKAEMAFLTNDIGKAKELLSDLINRFPYHPRFNYDMGVVSLRIGQYIQAKSYFYTAGLFAHPDALDALRRTDGVQNYQARQMFPELFKNIQNNEYEEALNLLSSLKETSLAAGYAIEAYCYKKLGEMEECITSCVNSLSYDLIQPELLHYLWYAYVSLQDDNKALETALLNIKLFPQNPQAYTDVLDTYLLLGKYDEAKIFALAYLTIATDYNAALHNLFKYYNAVRDWESLSLLYEVILPHMNHKTPETLIEHCESLIEIGEYETASQEIQSVIRAYSASTTAVLTYCRAMARSGDTNSAVNLLKTLLHAPNSEVTSAEHYLAVSLLSELLRNNGHVDESMALWKEYEPIDANTFNVAGPRPLIEYCYCLATIDRYAEAVMLSRQLAHLAPHSYLVKDLQERLSLRN